MVVCRKAYGNSMVNMWCIADAQQLRREEKAWNENEENEQRT